MDERRWEEKPWELDLEERLWRARELTGNGILRRVRQANKKYDAASLARTGFRRFTGGTPHEHQERAAEAIERFIALCAGTQSGKTVGACRKFIQRIIDENVRNGLYWMVAPDSLVGRTMRERFELMAPPGWIIDSRGAEHNRYWVLRNGARVEFRSGEKGDRLVSATLNGVWIDEFTLLKPNVWSSSIRTRFGATMGWAIFSGTPTGRGWAYDEIWRRCLDGDDLRDPDFLGLTWHTADNPAVKPEEIASARRTMPPAYFKRNYEASWETFHGQIYEHWNESKFVLSAIRIPPAQRGVTFLAVDWGFDNPQCALVIHADNAGNWFVIDEVYKAKCLPSWWHQKVKDDLLERYNIERGHCDPAEPKCIASMTIESGVRCFGAPNDVKHGIKEIAEIIFQGRLFVHKRCTNLIGQLSSYRWKTIGGASTEQPVKENDHAVDALRYGILGERRYRGLAGQEVATSSA